MLKISPLNKKDFPQAMEILNEELGKNRVRSANFLLKKFKQFPKFFIGVYLDKELIGIICGFPREDYLLISELAIDSRFHRRNFGRKLVEEFEEVAKKENYNKINVGAQDESVGFYSSLRFEPFLLIQFNEKDYSKGDFKNFDIIRYALGIIEVKTKECDIPKLIKLRKKYPKAYFQYIFTKKIK